MAVTISAHAGAGPPPRHPEHGDDEHEGEQGADEKQPGWARSDQAAAGEEQDRHHRRCGKRGQHPVEGQDGVEAAHTFSRQ